MFIIGKISSFAKRNERLEAVFFVINKKCILYPFFFTVFTDFPWWRRQEDTVLEVLPW